MTGRAPKIVLGTLRRRFQMMMLEHEGKALLASAGVPTAIGVVVDARANVEELARQVTQFPVAVKAQVRSGGRGRQGGVKQVKDAAALVPAVKQILGTEF